MAIVRDVLARVFVDDLDEALPTYERLGGGQVRRFAFRDVELAWVGPFLLIAASEEQRAAYARTATLLVEDVEAARAVVESTGGAVLEGPADAPNGPRMVARHADGAVFEYVEPRP